jgi:hypothetical protein
MSALRLALPLREGDNLIDQTQQIIYICRPSPAHL